MTGYPGKPYPTDIYGNFRCIYEMLEELDARVRSQNEEIARLRESVFGKEGETFLVSAESFTELRSDPELLEKMAAAAPGKKQKKAKPEE